MAEKYSTRKSTTKPLINGNVFWGQAELASSWSKFRVVVAASRSGSLVIQQSQDAVSWDYEKTHAIPAYVEGSGNYEKILGRIELPYFRLYFENTSGSDQIFLRISTMLYQSGHLEAQEDRVGLSAVNSTTLVMEPVNLVEDINGKKRLCVDSEISIEGITLTPQTDGISIYGTDGANPIQLKTDATEVGSLKTTNTDVSKLEVNANKASSETIFIPIGSANVSYVSNTDMTAMIDLGTGEDRYRNVLFRGKVDASVKTTPRIAMIYSHDGSGYTSDGTYCSFYKNGTDWEFAFQRSNIGCRYVGLKCLVECDINFLSAVISKN
jgi:hypothetical protein